MHLSYLETLYTFHIFFNTLQVWHEQCSVWGRTLRVLSVISWELDFSVWLVRARTIPGPVWVSNSAPSKHCVYFSPSLNGFLIHMQWSALYWVLKGGRSLECFPCAAFSLQHSVLFILATTVFPNPQLHVLNSRRQLGSSWVLHPVLHFRNCLKATHVSNHIISSFIF